MLRTFWVFLLCLAASSVSFGQQALPRARHRAVIGRGYYVSPSALDYSEAAEHMTREAQTAYAKAQAIYLWMCHNIRYDTETDIRTADQCWKERKGVCQGYCELFYRLGDCVGLETNIIYGKCRNANGKQEEHAWLSVETEQGDILIDPTWGAGMMKDGGLKHQSIPLLWFDVDPQWFVFTHLPLQKKYQHLEERVTKKEFDQLYYMTPLAATLGINPKQLRQDMQNGPLDLPHIPAQSMAASSNIAILEAPQQYHLTAGQPYTFRVEKKKDCLLSIENGKDHYAEKDWTKDGNLYSITITPKQSGPLALTVSTQGFVQLSIPIIEYSVAE